MNTLVVPTNRPDRIIEFLEAWYPWPWDSILIIEDAPRITLELPTDRWAESEHEVQIFSWREIDESLPNPWVISRSDSAIRAFGFWKAWKDGADVVFTLDDDCYPTGDDLVRMHLGNLQQTPAWQSSVAGLRVRGLPYGNQGMLRDVCVSVGLWLGSTDLDAIQTLARKAGAVEAELVAATTTRVMPSHQYFPMSGMNLAVRREAACLMYYPPMGLDSPYRRFDDIWCGIALQRICRQLRLPIVCGRPFVEHIRASEPFANLEKEAAGISANEGLWQVVDAADLEGTTPLSCMIEMGAHLRANGDANPYFELWGRAILEWCKLFGDEKPTTIRTAGDLVT